MFLNLTRYTGRIVANSQGYKKGIQTVLGMRHLNPSSSDPTHIIVHEAGATYWSARGESSYSPATYVIYQVDKVLEKYKKFQVRIIIEIPVRDWAKSANALGKTYPEI